MSDIFFSNNKQVNINTMTCIMCGVTVDIFIPIFCGCNQECCTLACDCCNIPVNAPICTTCGDYEYLKIGIAGQSNTNGSNSDILYTKTSKGGIWNGSTFEQYKDPVLPGKNASWYPELSNNMTKFPLLIHAGSDGRGFCLPSDNSWGNSSHTCYIDAVSKYLNAGNIDIMIFFGGEAEIINGWSKTLTRSGIDNFVSNIRNDLSKPDLKIYFVIPYCSSYSQANNDNVREALREKIASDSNLFEIADAYNYRTYTYDNIHLGKDGCDLLGCEIARFLNG